MRHWLFAISSVLSLLLLVASVALWVRSYWVQDEVRHSSACLWRAVSARGGLFVERLWLYERYGAVRNTYLSSPPYIETPLDYWDSESSGPRPARRWQWNRRHFSANLAAWFVHLSMTNRPLWHFPFWPTAGRTQLVAGTSLTTSDPGHTTEHWLIGHEAWVPYWLAAAIFAVLPAIHVRRRLLLWRTRARRLAGLCPRCGYDLRASPGRCPECGAAD